jgi:hypothetical protein
MSNNKWICTEEQLDSVNRGKLCPACLSNNVKCVGANPDLTNLNAAYDCLDCGEMWEGY